MTSRDHRAQLLAQFDARRPQPAGYLLRRVPSGRALLASTPDLQSLQGRLAVGRTTGLPGVLDRRLLEDSRRDGVAAFELGELDRLDVRDGMTAAGIAGDLAALELFGREKLAGADLYSCPGHGCFRAHVARTKG